MSFENKTIIITGASTGIGHQLARQLAARGANLALAARDAAALAKVEHECAERGARAVAIPTDVSEEASCRELVDKTVEHFGRLDALVNNAGISMHALFSEVTDLGVFERLMQVNYLGAVYCTHHALPHLKLTKGLVVAVSSLQGKTGFPRSTGYSASKHAMQGFFDSLRIELAASGVDVLVVSPGPVATAIHTRRLAGDGQTTSETARTNDAGMPAEECARQIVHAMERRRRELVMTAAGKWGQWLKLVAPGWTDRLVANAVRRFYNED